MAARRGSDMEAGETPPVVKAPAPPAPPPAPLPPESIPSGPSYGAPVPVRIDLDMHKGTGGLFGALGSAASAVGGAVGSVGTAIGGAVETLGRAADAAKDVAVNSVAIQIGAAIATGGLSLVGQAVAEKATGKGGPVTGFVSDVVTNPGEVLKKLPGTVLTETGVVGVVADVASLAGGVASAVAPNSSLGKVGAAMQRTVEQVQQATKDNPVASLTIIAGVAGTAAGLPGAAKLLQDGVTQLAGRPEAPPAAQAGNTGLVPGQQVQLTQASEVAAPQGPGKGAVVALGGLALGAAVLGAVLA